MAEVVFSGRTYQIHCDASDETSWVFLQLDSLDAVKDIFCGCVQCSETGACPHMAAALFAIFEPYCSPMHKRFEDSLFFRLFSAHSQSHEHCFVRRNKDEARFTGRLIFTGTEEWVTKATLTGTKKDEETEETSIKFSDVSDEELIAWREKRPTQRLRFELSPYSNLAKWLFLLDESCPCRASISNEGPPMIELAWEQGSCHMPIACPVDEVLDTLGRTKTASRKHPTLSFDPKTRLCTVVDPDRRPEGPGSSAELVGPSTALSSDEEVVSFLATHYTPCAPSALSYRILPGKPFHVEPYLEHPGDLASARFFGNSWFWRADLGFQRIPFPCFPFHSFKLPPDQIDEFLAVHRHLLSTVPGCSIHDHPPKKCISFEVDAGGALTFSQTDAAHEQGAPVDASDQWVFVEGEGFFTSKEAPPEYFAKPIPPHKVGPFIRKEINWLKTVPGFFAPRSPIQAAGLQIRYTGNAVELTAACRWLDASSEASAILYDDVGFLQNVGFFSLPPLPVPYGSTKVTYQKQREEWDHFFLEELPRLRREFLCTIDPALDTPTQLSLVCQEAADPSKNPGSGVYEAGLYWESEKGKITPAELLAARKRGERFLPTEAGLVDLEDQRFGWLQTVQAPRAGPIYRLRATDVLKIHAHDDISFKGSSRTAEFINRLLTACPKTAPKLLSMKSTLRPYQENGVSWLWHLYLSGLSGLLCDDMGVGKTHQAIGLLSAVQTEKHAQFLIICPTSLLWHWRDKLRTVLPASKVFVYFGGKRELDHFSNDDDIFLTTYGIWRNEIQSLRELQFEVAIFDELQIAKNHVSQIWTALSQVRARMRLGLTGTPIENQLRELKAVFDLIVPGYLPPDPVFRELCTKNSNTDNDRICLLSRYVRPFVLRRRKQEVLKDLPPKTEDLYTANLVGEQKELYKQVVVRQASPLISQLNDAHSPIPYMHIFALLSALKQICNHPAAYLKDTAHYQSYESGKWDIFVELLEEALGSGQKVVVFSQYLSMLDIMELYLRSKNIKYAEVRGSTKARGDEIALFQSDPGCLVFLGSLHAAGLGIDLSAGSVVIHYDRWWNAARENQATDRVHRIGQHRGVMVYKLMTSNTIEERIDHLISSKSQLLEEVVAHDDHQVVKKMDRKELLSLLEGLEPS